MRIFQASCGLIVLGVLAGCHASSEPAAPKAADQPTTMPMPETNMKSPAATMPVPSAAPKAEPKAPAAVLPKPADMTHMVSAEEPIFSDMPAADAKPAGMLKKGSKVLVLVPGAEYSQVLTDTGATGYAPTAGLDPLGK